MSVSTTDLCDAHEDALETGALRVLPPVYGDFGGRRRFHGPIETLKVFEDNAMVRKLLETPGAGRVLVVDGGGSLRCALVGGNLGKLAQDNGWTGVIVHGCVRDTVELAACEVGVRALGLHPRRSHRRGLGEQGVRVQVSGVLVVPGQWCYADEDGILISDTALS